MNNQTPGLYKQELVIMNRRVIRLEINIKFLADKAGVDHDKVIV